nr:MAG: hypothetical protein [Bacteriophage sp.]
MLGLFDKVCQLARVEKVFKPLKIYIHFIFSVLTDNSWQEESNPLAACDIEIIIGDFPLSRIK